MTKEYRSQPYTIIDFLKPSLGEFNLMLLEGIFISVPIISATADGFKDIPEKALCSLAPQATTYLWMRGIELYGMMNKQSLCHELGLLLRKHKVHFRYQKLEDKIRDI